jgi:hypothetical protein
MPFVEVYLSVSLVGCCVNNIMPGIAFNKSKKARLLLPGHGLSA